MNGVGTEDSLLRKSKNKGRQEKEEGWKRRKTGKGGRQKKEEDRKRRKAEKEGRQEKEEGRKRRKAGIEGRQEKEEGRKRRKTGKGVLGKGVLGKGVEEGNEGSMVGTELRKWILLELESNHVKQPPDKCWSIHLLSPPPSPLLTLVLLTLFDLM